MVFQFYARLCSREIGDFISRWKNLRRCNVFINILRPKSPLYGFTIIVFWDFVMKYPIEYQNVYLKCGILKFDILSWCIPGVRRWMNLIDLLPGNNEEEGRSKRYKLTCHAIFTLRHKENNKLMQTYDILCMDVRITCL